MKACRWTSGILTVIGIVCIALPFHISMTGICLLLLAAVILTVGILKNRGKGKAIRMFLMICTAAAIAAVLVSMIIISAVGRDDDLAGTPPEMAVVLGAQVHGDQPSLTLKKRLDAATLFLNENPDARIIVTGGQGKDELYPESEVMSTYLKQRGIAADRIILERESTNTRQNLENAMIMAKEQEINTDAVLIFTSEFHMARAKYIARSLGMKAYGISSRTWPWILKVNYELREVFAFIKALLFRPV